MERLQNMATPSRILQNTKKKPSEVQSQSQLNDKPDTGH